MKRILTMAISVLLMTACAPEVGSERWCEALEEKPAGDWSTNEVADYTQHCLFKAGE
jgi:hypothetical protein